MEDKSFSESLSHEIIVESKTRSGFPFSVRKISATIASSPAIIFAKKKREDPLVQTEKSSNLRDVWIIVDFLSSVGNPHYAVRV